MLASTNKLVVNMASNDHTNPLAQELDEMCAQSIRVGALIDVFQRFNFT